MQNIQILIQTFVTKKSIKKNIGIDKLSFGQTENVKEKKVVRKSKMKTVYGQMITLYILRVVNMQMQTLEVRFYQM